jgi:hypothetical protein
MCWERLRIFILVTWQQDLNGQAGKAAMQQMNQSPPHAATKKNSLSLPQQYARV